MKFTFQLGMALVFVGVAIGAGVNYLDMRQFEARIPGMATAGWSPTDASVIYPSLEANDEYSKRNFSPEISLALMRDYSFLGNESKRQFQQIRDSVSKKKLAALHNMTMFLLFACSLGLLHSSALRQFQTKQA